MATYLTDIRAFLAGLLNAYQPTNVAWDNVQFDPATPSYLSFVFSPVATKQIEYGTYGRDERSGIVQVKVMEPSGNGSGPALAKAESVAAVFPRGLSGVSNGTSILVTNTTIGPAVQTNTHYVVPVTITWKSVNPPVGV